MATIKQVNAFRRQAKRHGIMPTEVFVVIGQTGIYSDRHEWPAVVVATREEAERWVVRLTEDGERARREHKAMVERHEEIEVWAGSMEWDGPSPELETLIATMLDGHDARDRVLHSPYDPLRYKIESTPFTRRSPP